MPKPSSVLDVPNYYLQDVFFNTRPEPFNFDNDPNEGEPYFKNYNNDTGITDVYWDEFKNNYKDQNIFYDSDNAQFIKKDSPKSLVALYRLQNNPVSIKYTFGPHHMKTAVSLSDLAKSTSQFSKSHAPKCNANIVQSATDLKHNRFTYRVKCYDRKSDPAGHIVTVQLNPHEGQTKILEMDVQVSCSCEFWQYWGPDFNADKGNYLEGDPMSDGGAPNVRDKGRRNLICKHVYTVSRVFERFVYKHQIRIFKDINEILDALSKDTIPDLIERSDDILSTLSENARKKLQPFIDKLKDKPTDKTLKDKFVVKLKDVLPEETKEKLEKLKREVKKPVKPEIKEILQKPEEFITDLVKQVNPKDREELEDALKKKDKSKIVKFLDRFVPQKLKNVFKKLIDRLKGTKKSSSIKPIIRQVIASYDPKRLEIIKRKMKEM